MSEISEVYRRRADAFEAMVVATAPERWTSPSPCEKWLARDVVAHVVEMHEIVLKVGASTDLDPAAAFRAARARAEQILDDPNTPPELIQEIDGVLSADLPQHLWDLAKATRQDATIDEVDVEFLWGELSVFTAEQWEFMRTPGKFGPGIEVYGPEVMISADAPLQDRLLGLLGRDPAWTPPL